MLVWGEGGVRRLSRRNLQFARSCVVRPMSRWVLLLEDRNPVQMSTRHLLPRWIVDMFVLCHWPLRIIPRFRIVHRLPRRLHLFGHRHPNQMSHRNLFARRCRDLYQLRRRDLRIFGRFDVVHNMPGGVFLYRHWDRDEMPRRNILAWGFVDVR